MKKTLVVLLILAVAGGVFAQDLSLGGEVFFGANLFAGSTEKDVNDEKKPLMADPLGQRVRFQGSIENDESTFGGWFRFQADAMGGPSLGLDLSGADPEIDLKGIGAWAYAWWQPMDMLRLTMGQNPDGFFGKDGVARWGFYQDMGDIGVMKEGWIYSAAFYGGWGNAGALITLTPMDALTVNVAIPFGAAPNGEAGDVYRQINAQVAYDLGDIGDFAITYQGGFPGSFANPLDPDNPYVASNDDGDPLGTHKLYAYFHLGMIENLGVDIGLGYTLPYGIADVVTYHTPLAIGLGATYDAGQFGVKFRAQAQLAGKYAPDGGDDAKIPFQLDLDVLPYYNISDTMTFWLSAGLAMTGKLTEDHVGYTDSDADDAVIGWHVEPLLTVTGGGGRFYIGFRVGSDGSKDKQDNKFINWSIPIGVKYSF